MTVLRGRGVDPKADDNPGALLSVRPAPPLTAGLGTWDGVALEADEAAAHPAAAMQSAATIAPVTSRE
ncbi:hypothetical protein [Trebonia kvetii]|uniref:hypothetical protein n=1 Tax=Trebonia kvetii TaxID=2480626 RepID=UPI001C9E5855|nr:hypothetical protein [Trebonia kvetii]